MQSTYIFVMNTYYVSNEDQGSRSAYGVWQIPNLLQNITKHAASNVPHFTASAKKNLDKSTSSLKRTTDLLHFMKKP